MKYVVEVVINKDREFVVNQMRDKEAAFKWMEGLQSFDLIEGNNEEINSKYKMVFLNKGRKEEMIETITDFDPPKQITTVYQMGSVVNECVNIFEENNEKTTYRMNVDFKFGLPWVLFAWAMKPMFKKQSLKGMIAFKDYVESL